MMNEMKPVLPNLAIIKFSTFVIFFSLYFFIHHFSLSPTFASLLYRDRNRMRDILNLHLVRDRLNTERIRQGNLHTVSKIIFFSCFKKKNSFET